MQGGFAAIREIMTAWSRVREKIHSSLASAPLRSFSLFVPTPNFQALTTLNLSEVF